jgi:ribosomal protein S6
MELPPSAERSLERAVKLMEDIIRYLVVCKEVAPPAEPKQ